MVDGKLVWVSIQYGPEAKDGGINFLDLAARTNVHHHLPGRPGFFVTTEQPGVLLIGLERRLVLYDVAARRITATLAHVPDNPRILINDGIAIPGGVLFGTKDVQFQEPIAALYRYHFASRELRELLGGQTCSNGKLLRGSRLIDIDSVPRTITEYLHDGALERVRLIAPAESLPAIPDGLRPAPGGESIVVAFVNLDAGADGLAQQIRIADGVVLTEWIFPGAPRVTCPEYVHGLGWLFTTAVEGAAAPEAGTIFVGPISDLSHEAR